MEVYFDKCDEWMAGFAKAAGIDLERATDKELAFLSRLMEYSRDNSYQGHFSRSYVEKKLREARKTGKNIRIVPDRKFWKNDSARDQLDGWTYHLQLYTQASKRKE